jgi:uncharacterized repeat protein (TIGR03833 family)
MAASKLPFPMGGPTDWWEEANMNGQQRKNIRSGVRVEIVLKKDQRSGKRTVGVVKDILTSSAFHSRGI